MGEILREGEIDFEDFISCHNIDPDMKEKALEDLEQFSDNLLFDDDYVLKINN